MKRFTSAPTTTTIQSISVAIVLWRASPLLAGIVVTAIGVPVLPNGTLLASFYPRAVLSPKPESFVMRSFLPHSNVVAVTSRLSFILLAMIGMASVTLAEDRPVADAVGPLVIIGGAESSDGGILKLVVQMAGEARMHD